MIMAQKKMRAIDDSLFETRPLIMSCPDTGRLTS
jgi:hypothetical protein